MGFSAEDAESVWTWFAGIEEGLHIACCREDLLGRTMDDIFSAPFGLLQQQLEWQQQVEAVPRAVIFSGMTQREMLGIAEFWSLSGKLAGCGIQDRTDIWQLQSLAPSFDNQFTETVRLQQRGNSKNGI